MRIFLSSLVVLSAALASAQPFLIDRSPLLFPETTPVETTGAVGTFRYVADSFVATREFQFRNGLLYGTFLPPLVGIRLREGADYATSTITIASCYDLEDQGPVVGSPNGTRVFAFGFENFALGGRTFSPGTYWLEVGRNLEPVSLARISAVDDGITGGYDDRNDRYTTRFGGDLAFSFGWTPEPSSMLVLGTGLAWARRRRARR